MGATAAPAVATPVEAAVKKGERVALVGFGTFERQDRKARTARNPRSGAPVKVKATKVPRFRAGQGFKDVVAGKATAPKLTPVKSTAKATTAKATTTARATVSRASTAKASTAKKASTARTAPSRTSAAKPAKSTAKAASSRGKAKSGKKK